MYIKCIYIHVHVVIFKAYFYSQLSMVYKVGVKEYTACMYNTTCSNNMYMVKQMQYMYNVYCGWF